MKLRARVKNGYITRITLVSEDPGDKAVLQALWDFEVSRERIIYQGGKVIVQAKVSQFRRR